MSSIDKLPSPNATLSNDTPAPSPPPDHSKSPGPTVNATPTPFAAVPGTLAYKSDPPSKPTGHAPAPTPTSSASETKTAGAFGTTPATLPSDALAPRAATLKQQASSLYEQSPSYSKQGEDYVRQILVAHAAELGLSPDDAQHLDLNRVYWTEFEPRFLPSNGPVGYPPRLNSDAGKFVRSVPLSLVPITNLINTWQRDNRVHITTSMSPDQTADRAHDVINPSRFAQYFKDKNSTSGGFKAAYKHDVQTYFDAHRQELRHYQQDKALLALDAQEAGGHAPIMDASDYTLLRQALQDHPDPSLKGKYLVFPLQINGYVSPSALVVTDERANGATYLYLPGEPQPFLRFKDDSEAKRYIENRTDGPAGAHDFATTYFSRNDALGNWNAILPGVETFLNETSDARHHPQTEQYIARFGDPLLTHEDGIIQMRSDITDDPFGKQVDNAKEKALDQADFDITSESDKTDQLHYDEVDKYKYVPFSEVIQLLYAKTGTQKREVLTKLAIDAVTTVVMDGAGKGFAPLARNILRMPGKEGAEAAAAVAEDGSSLLPTGKSGIPKTDGITAPEPMPIKDDQLPPAASVPDKELQTQGDTKNLASDYQGNRYWNYNGKRYLLSEDRQLSRPGHPVYRPVDPDNPYAFPTTTNVLVPDGNGGLALRKAGLAGGSNSYEDLERWLDDYNKSDDEVEESDFDRYLREEREYEQAAASQTPAPGPSAPNPTTSTSGTATSSSAAGASTPSTSTPVPVPGASPSGEPFSSTFAHGVEKGFAQGQIALDQVTTLPPISAARRTSTPANTKTVSIGQTPVSGHRFIYNRVFTVGTDKTPYGVVKKALEDSGYETMPIAIRSPRNGGRTPCLKATKAGHSFYVYPKKGMFWPIQKVIQSRQPAFKAHTTDTLPHLLAIYCPDAQGNSGYLYFANF